MHPPTGNRQFRAQLLRAGKSAKITFSKIKFLSLECRGNTRFLKNYGISVKITVKCTDFFCFKVENLPFKVYFIQKEYNHYKPK